MYKIIFSLIKWVYSHRVTIVNVLLCGLFLYEVVGFCHFYSNYKKDKEFIENISPILQEMDTTYSIRNYDVMRVKLYDEIRKWEDGAYDE